MICHRTTTSWRAGRLGAWRAPNGFTMAAGLALPALARSKEKARVAKAHGELYGIGLALRMYSDDNEGRVPPVRVNCNTDLALHWCQLPDELSRDGYLPRGSHVGREANLEDVFNPGFTYKYATPGPQFLNGEPNGTHKLWIPDSFPSMSGETGNWHSDVRTSPVRWVVWSMGPRPGSPKSQSGKAPLSGQTWYRETQTGGVIARFADRDGVQFKSP
jgi:hypothetical protein